MIVAGIDPGKKGYQCLLQEAVSPLFWPSFVTDPEDDEKVQYDAWEMAVFCLDIKAMNVDLVVLEKQAPRRHGSGKFGQGKEGTVSSWTNGFGFGLWVGCLTSAGFSEENKTLLIVEPLTWKRRMGVLASHTGEDTHAARRKAADKRSVEVAQRVGPGIDFRPTERSPGARVESPDKACAYLLAQYGKSILLQETKK